MRRSPYAFTELGVAMLSSVLNSKAAIQINMSIMRAFVAIRQLIANPPVDRVGELEKANAGTSGLHGRSFYRL